MTPLQIKMMLHYYAIAEPYSEFDSAHASSPAVVEQRAALVCAELLVPDEESPSLYQVTDRGRAYVEALQQVPMPIKKWVMPGFEWSQH